MKKIEAVVQPSKLTEIKEVLTRMGVRGMTVAEVRGYGRQKGHREVYRGAEYEVAFVRKTRVEVVVTDDLADRAVTALRQAAFSGRVGDGKIFVTPVEEAVRIRTGERGREAVSTGGYRES